MRLINAFALALGLLALGGVAAADEKADQKALKELEGTYLLIGMDNKGMKLTEEDLKAVPEAKRTFVIKGDKISMSGNGKGDPATIKVDAAQTPAHFDVTTVKGGKTEVDHGIYKLENGILTICATDGGDAKERPKEFKAGDKGIVMTLKKQNAK